MNTSRQLFAFLIVGGSCTAFHYLVLIALVSIGTLSPAFASSIGFSVSAVLNYAFNRRLTFKSDASHHAAFPKFLGVAISGFGLNAALLLLLNEKLGWHYMVAQIIATAITLMWNFTFHKIWTFGTLKHKKS